MGPPVYCGVCRTALDVHRDSADPDRLTYRHTAANLRLAHTDGGHEPVPVGLADLDGTPIMCCDVCTFGTARWSYLAAPLSVVMGDADGDIVQSEHYDAGWAVCDGCADIIDEGKVGGLVRAAMAGGGRDLPPYVVESTRRMLADLYRALLASISGGRMPLAHTVEGPTT